jgi:hypothetical protein
MGDFWWGFALGYVARACLAHIVFRRAPER